MHGKKDSLTPCISFARAKEDNMAIGTGAICPRCLGPKSPGWYGVGISLSRRGKAYICSDCGIEEALIDFHMNGPKDALARELRLKEALKPHKADRR